MLRKGIIVKISFLAVPCLKIDGFSRGPIRFLAQHFGNLIVCVIFEAVKSIPIFSLVVAQSLQSDAQFLLFTCRLLNTMQPSTLYFCRETTSSFALSYVEP